MYFLSLDKDFVFEAKGSTSVHSVSKEHRYNIVCTHTQDHRQYRQMQFGKKYFATQSAWLMSTFERSNSSAIHALPSCKRVVSYPRTLSREPSFCKADITLTHFQKQLQPFVSSGNLNVCKCFTCTVK